MPAIAIYLLQSAGNLGQYVATSFYVLLTAISLIVLILIKSDDEYYSNFGPANMFGAVIVGLAMTALSWGLSVAWLNKPEMLLALSKPAIAPLLSALNLSVIPTPTSVSTMLLSQLLFGLVMAAASEELFRLPFFSEGKQRWKNGIKIGKLTLPGVLLYVGFPVGFWAALHAVQSYENPLFVIPAAVNGVILTIYLWKTRCILGCIFAHFIYNAGIIILTYARGIANVPSGTPIIPNIFSGEYWATSAFVLDGLLIAIVIWGFIFFLLPSLKRDKT